MKWGLLTIRRGISNGTLEGVKILALYRPNSEYARQLEEFARDLSRRFDRQMELINIDSRDGAAMASLYDIMQFPSILAIANDGSLLKSWSGPILPLMDEVVYYAPDRLQNSAR